MNIGVKNLTGRKLILPIAGIGAFFGAIVFLWPYKGLLFGFVIAVVYSFAAYHAGKMRRN